MTASKIKRGSFARLMLRKLSVLGMLLFSFLAASIAAASASSETLRHSENCVRGIFSEVEKSDWENEPQSLINTRGPPANLQLVASECLVASNGGLSIPIGSTPAGDVLDRAQLINYLIDNGTRISADDVVDIRQLPDGRTVWLETGNNRAGLEHIYNHADEFAQKGISREEIPDAVFSALEEGNIVGHQGSGTGRPIYEFEFNGQTQRIAITVGDNGFIVGANPKSVP